MDAVILAGGGNDQHDALYPLLQGKPKALLEVAGKPMVQWILDALSSSNLIDHVVVVGLNENSGIVCTHPLLYAQDHGGLIENIIAGAEVLDQQINHSEHCMILSADIPTITAKMIDWEINLIQESNHDIYYNVIERSVMEARFPGSQRSYYYLRNMQVCGGDVNAIRTSFVTHLNPTWLKLVKNRKNAFKQALVIGIDTFILFAFRMFTLELAEKWFSRRLNCSGKAILNPFAETGMDVDKPYQYELVQKDLATSTR